MKKGHKYKTAEIADNVTYHLLRGGRLNCFIIICVVLLHGI